MAKHSYKFNGEIVHEGDTINSPLTLTPEVIKFLKEFGGLTEEVEVPNNQEYYLTKVAKRLGFENINDPKFIQWSTILIKGSSFTFTDLLLKEIAIELDKKYKGYITDCKAPYVVSRIDYKSIGRIALSSKKTAPNVALFRTKEDAEFALNLVYGNEF